MHLTVYRFSAWAEENTMDIKWEDDFVISVRADNGSTIITANKEGLRSLASQLNALAEEPAGSHIHYDCYNSLNEGSIELIIEKTF